MSFITFFLTNLKLALQIKRANASVESTLPFVAPNAIQRWRIEQIYWKLNCKPGDITKCYIDGNMKAWNLYEHYIWKYTLDKNITEQSCKSRNFTYAAFSDNALHDAAQTLLALVGYLNREKKRLPLF